jgi:hypothetical protein
MGRRWRLNDTVDDDSRRDDDPWRDDTAREAQLSEHGQQRFVELERRCLRAVRADEPLTEQPVGGGPPPPALAWRRGGEITPVPALTTQMLAWLDEHPRSYAETLDAWKTSCPRLSIWEDAIADRLIRLESGRVHLTPVGRAILGKR